MQNNGSQGGQNQNNQQPNSGAKPGGLSWSQPASAGSNPNANPQPKPAVPPMAPPKGNAVSAATPAAGNKRFLSILAGGIILGFALGWAWFAFRPAPDETAMNAGNTADTADANTPSTLSGSDAASGGQNTVVPMPGSSSTAAVGVQAPAGDFVSVPTPQAPGTQVLVSGFKVSQPTWIVVYDNKNGVRGNALGAALFFPASPNASVNISLLRGTVENQTYLVGTNVDNGDKVFSTQQDGPVVDASGNPVYQTFEVR